MLRPIDILMIGLLLGGAAFTFKVKHNSEVAIERVAKLEKQIKAEQDAIDVLQADWSLLTDPSRLAQLLEKYGEQLGVEQAESTSVSKISEIPVRPLQPPQGADEGIAGLIDEGAGAITGSVQPAPSRGDQ